MNKEEACDLIKEDLKEGEILLEDALLQAYNAGYDARAEIAKQDEKELVEVLKNVCRKLDIDDITDSRTIAEEELFIKITSVIEKHKGKTWEEIVEDSDG